MDLAPYRPITPATPKQRGFIERLLAERDLVGTGYEGWTPDWDRASSAAASLVIAFLTSLPKRPATPFVAGVYRCGNGALVRVYLGQKSGQMLAKRVIASEDGVEYLYLGLAAKVVYPSAVRLSMEEVGALGKAFDHCLMCGRRLDDPESQDRGIGPVCARKYA